MNQSIVTVQGSERVSSLRGIGRASAQSPEPLARGLFQRIAHWAIPLAVNHSESRQVLGEAKESGRVLSFLPRAAPRTLKVLALGFALI